MGFIAITNSDTFYDICIDFLSPTFNNLIDSEYNL